MTPEKVGLDRKNRDALNDIIATNERMASELGRVYTSDRRAHYPAGEFAGSHWGVGFLCRFLTN